MTRPEENPLASIVASIAFSSRDWSANHRDAWVYGVAIGWDTEALVEVAARHKWDAATVARLEELHRRYLMLGARRDFE